MISQFFQELVAGPGASAPALHHQHSIPTKFTHTHSKPLRINQTANMSFFGMGRPQLTSEEKVAQVEGEMRMMADSYNRYAHLLLQVLRTHAVPVPWEGS